MLNSLLPRARFRNDRATPSPAAAEIAVAIEASRKVIAIETRSSGSASSAW